MQQRIFSYALRYDCATLTTTSCFDFFLFLFFFSNLGLSWIRMEGWSRIFPVYISISMFFYFLISIFPFSFYLSISLSFLFCFLFTFSFCLWECECLRSVFVTQWITTLAWSIENLEWSEGGISYMRRMFEFGSFTSVVFFRTIFKRTARDRNDLSFHVYLPSRNHFSFPFVSIYKYIRLSFSK